jgi:hypothetical protein
MFVWSWFCSPDRRFPQMSCPPGRRRACERLGDRPDAASAFFKRGPFKVGNPHVDFTQKAFERSRGRAMLGWLDWGIPPVAHQVGCTVKRHSASPAGSVPARCRFSGTYGG